MAVRCLCITGNSSSTHGFYLTSAYQQIQFATFSQPGFPFLQYSVLPAQHGNGGHLYVQQPHFGLVSLREVSHLQLLRQCIRLVHRAIEHVLRCSNSEIACPCRYGPPGQGTHDRTDARQIPDGCSPQRWSYGARG